MATSLSFLNELIVLIFIVSGVIWMGLTLYCSLIAQEFLLTATKEQKDIYYINIQTKIMSYMRWSSLISFSTSIYLMSVISRTGDFYNIGTSIAALVITIMFFNTWAIIWPKQKRIISNTSDRAKCEKKYDLAIRTNSILAFPLIGLVIFSAQAKQIISPLIDEYGNFGPGWESTTLWISIAIILALQANLFFGKKRKWMDSSKKIILCGIFLIIFIGYILRVS